MIAPPCFHAGKFDAWKNLRYHDVAGWSSLVARWAHNPKVVGSNPTPATNQINYFCAIFSLRAWERGRVIYRQQEGGKNPEQERDSAGPDAVHIAAAAVEECEFL